MPLYYNSFLFCATFIFQSDSRLPIPLASIEQQHKTVEEIEAKLSVCDSIEKTVDTALQQAEALRQSILKKAFEGGL